MAFGIDTQWEARVPLHPSECERGGEKNRIQCLASGPAPQAEGCLSGDHVVAERVPGEVLGCLPGSGGPPPC